VRQFGGDADTIVVRFRFAVTGQSMGFEQLAALKAQLTKEAKLKKQHEREADTPAPAAKQPGKSTAKPAAKTERPGRPARPARAGAPARTDAVSTWCRGSRYWACLTDGAARVDLSGAQAGTVTSRDAAFARNQSKGGPGGRRKGQGKPNAGGAAAGQATAGSATADQAAADQAAGSETAGEATASQATASQSTASQATASQATASQATASQATASHATASHATAGQATAEAADHPEHSEHPKTSHAGAQDDQPQSGEASGDASPN
jgi:ProP effector